MKKKIASSQNPFSESGSSPGASGTAVSAIAISALDPAEILTLEETAARLKVTPRFIYEKCRHRCQDPLPCVRVGRYLRFIWSDVSAWLQRHRNIPVEKREGRAA